MPEILLTEYVEIDGYPLATPAVLCESTADLWGFAEIPDSTLKVPFRSGVYAYSVSREAKRITLPLVISGDVDEDGLPAADIRAQLYANRNALWAAIRPDHANKSATRTLTWHLPDGSSLSGPCRLIGGMAPVEIGPSAMRASVDFLLTEGGLRSSTEIDVEGTDTTVVVPNPGDWQDALRIDLSGTATAVRLTNETLATDCYLEFGGDVSLGVSIDTAGWTAVRNLVSVVGLIYWQGHERWLPLAPGDNSILISPTGGTCTARFRHNPIYT